ncbi:MAG: phosphoribosyltransferase family protein [Gemmiger sp.]|uniref:ComF family protein n=1 Tax=Gemmiger sp. TaxID=2049027 RepID=UPI002E79DC09|nr:phosphoribosyltransferase family protein [Gemmiger sp.]MEE0801343.1 phosphoribosyltransferase family protein [Gemmiger sp.]
MNAAAVSKYGERLLAALYPRRCVLCGEVLHGDTWNGAVCRRCASEAERLRHAPPRLPDTEHFFYALTSAAGAFYYHGCVRHSILLCKRFGRPWYAREMADLMAVLVFGADPAEFPGRRPWYGAVEGFPLYHRIVPVPPRQRRRLAENLPELLARRLGQTLGIPVEHPLILTRKIRPQKSLDAAQRRRNTLDAYGCRAGTDLTGKRVLLVDDVITTGSTVSACALALIAAGAVSVDAVCFAADEELPRDKQRGVTSFFQMQGDNL